MKQDRVLVLLLAKNACFATRVLACRTLLHQVDNFEAALVFNFLVTQPRINDNELNPQPCTQKPP